MRISHDILLAKVRLNRCGLRSTAAINFVGGSGDGRDIVFAAGAPSLVPWNPCHDSDVTLLRLLLIGRHSVYCKDTDATVVYRDRHRIQRVSP